MELFWIIFIISFVGYFVWDTFHQIDIDNLEDRIAKSYKRKVDELTYRIDILEKPKKHKIPDFNIENE